MEQESDLCVMGGSKARAPIMLRRGVGVESSPAGVEQRGRMRLGFVLDAEMYWEQVALRV